MAGGPVGTITFLFTDVEGSTGLWESDPAAMRQAISRHDEIIAATVEKSGGHLVKSRGEGDSAFAVFARATDAIASALDVQREIALEARPLRVRIALHTGEAEFRDGDYYGTAVNRCARLRAVAHGGQVVMSRTTHDVVAESLPAEAELVDLGPHRLRDLARPEHVFQLSHPDLPADFPSLRSLDTLPNNLPVQLTSFIGREQEIGIVRKLLDADRLVTLTGSGGCGKTRLALHVAAEVLDAYPDGVWWVDLAPLADPDLVASAVASALGAREVPGMPMPERVAAYLRERRALLLWDNCEHVIAACASFADALLRSCPGLVILATSREPMGVEGETTWRVPSLSLPASASKPSIEVLGTYEAVRLFIERALKARPNFAVTNDNAPAVAKICRRLDGIPLAIELAAARVRLLSADQIAQGLDDRFHLLTGGARTAVPRQQTLEASVDWSYDLLTDEERTLLRRLSVFAGSFILDAAEEVCSGDPIEAVRVLDLLTALVDRSLAGVEGGNGETRYRLLETIRQYGMRKLAEATEGDDLRSRHLDYMVAVTARAKAEARGERTAYWLDRMETELDDVRAALDYSAASAQHSQSKGLQIAASFWWFAGGRQSEGRARIESALAAADPDPALESEALVALSNQSVAIGDFEGAIKHADRAIEIARQIGDLSLEGRALTIKGWSEFVTSRAGGHADLEKALVVIRRAGDRFSEPLALIVLGDLAAFRGDNVEAKRFFEQANATAREAGNLVQVTNSLIDLGSLTWSEGKFREAERMADEALAVCEALRDEYFRPGALLNAGAARWARGEHEAGFEFIDAGLRRAREQMTAWTFQLLLSLADLEFSRGDLDAAEAAAREGLELSTAWPTYHALHRRNLGNVAFARGDLAAARSHFEEGMTEVGPLFGLPSGRALVHRAEGDLDRAEASAREALVGNRLWGLVGAIDSLEVLAGVVATLEDYDEAIRLFAVADSLRRSTEYVRAVPFEASVAADIAEAREALDDEAFDKAWTEGAALTAEEAVAYATRARGERKRPSTGWASLTPTEHEVVRLVRDGLSNPKIAEKMFISRRTVTTHLTHVFAKLRLSSRAELVAEAARRDL